MPTELSVLSPRILNKYERNGNSEEGCHLADMSRSQRTNKSDDRSLFTSQVQSVAEERDLRDTLSERGFHSQTLRKVFVQGNAPFIRFPF